MSDDLPEAEDAPVRPSPEAGVFATTRWSLVLSTRSGDVPESARALEQLCQAYWYPLYAHVRRQGVGPTEAEDLTQAYFARLLEKKWLQTATPERGRFRSFLLTSLQHFLANEWARARTQKRGGQFQFFSLDAARGEERWVQEPVTPQTPECEFDRRWAVSLLETVLNRLQQEYVQNGKVALFEQLKGAVGGDSSEQLETKAAPVLNLSPGAVRVAAHRLRRRYRELLREEISQTVASPSEVDQELRHLFAALSGTTPD